MPGKKTFAAGSVLTSADVNGYLMDQAVMRFASASARDTAIPSPTEGMVCYLDDLDTTYIYNGSAWIRQTSIGAWTSYTPTFTGVGSIGNSAFSFKYTQIGKTIIVRGQFIVGSTMSWGGFFDFSLPAAANGYIILESMGEASALRSTGPQIALGNVINVGSTTGRVGWQNTSLAYGFFADTNSTVPFTWVTNNYITIRIVYEAA